MKHRLLLTILISSVMHLSLCCTTGFTADAVDVNPPLTYYGGYFNVTRHWQNRVTTEYTNLTRINGDYESHLSQNAWLCRTRNQRIQYDIQYRFSLNLSDEEMLARLKENRDWLESKNMLDMIDMLYLADEPYGRGWTDADMNRICRLTEQIFPELNQLVTLNMYGIPGHTLPDTVDFVGAFNYNIGSPDKTYAQVMSDIETVVSAIREAGVTQPMLWIGQAAHGPPDDTRRMPTPEEMKWQHQACVELNRTQPVMNIIGLQWWQLENTGGWVGVAEAYFTTYVEQVQAHREIGREAGFAANTYTFVDLFETVPNPGDGYADGRSINGVNGWVCDYRGPDGVWHYRKGADKITADATVDGLHATQVLGHANSDAPVPRPAEVAFTSPSLGLAATGERFLVIDVAGRLGSTAGNSASSASFHLRDAGGTECVALMLLNDDNVVCRIALPLTDLQNTVNPAPIKGGNDLPFALRFVLDARDGSLDILNLHDGVAILGHDLQCFPEAIVNPPDRLVIRHLTSSHSLFDLDAVQAFTNRAYPEPRPVR